MLTKITKLALTALLSILFLQVKGQSELSENKRASLWRNFENVTLDSIKGRAIYEQRLDRNPLYGLLEMRKALRDSSVIEYLPMFQGVILGQYKLGNTIRFRSLPDEDRKLQRQRFFQEPKRYKFDFWLQPIFAANFGNRMKPIQSNTSILLQTQFHLWQGLVLNAGILFPITNDLDNRPKIIRPAPFFLNQFYASGKHFFSASLGYFYNDQYGFNFQYRNADLSLPLSFGFEGSLTGKYNYPRGGIYAGPIDQLLAIADISYRLNRPDVTLKLSGGQYLWKDRGVRFEFIRQFTNVEIGLYAMKTKNGSTAGFNFAIPIPPGKIIQGAKARFRTTDEFRWEYSYTRGFQIGERYRTGYQLDQKLRQYHVNYLNSQR
ncbi:Exopolysaccharide biosynthesis protein YbjH [Dyadobacter koreensis]|uniref:Exopolysaccharide biosynthesis protein YbjH n=1 Tax=Dyadobacter koreensis TaxID=408657 RepID=A0A1H6QJI4_9BACT|nr:YjbH domain-containing protein [Dyadobacter koreensis]SEI40297.1 Exopolysaccharide biosynthesis protein YbjH [Dyadobacter koreensis]